MWTCWSSKGRRWIEGVEIEMRLQRWNQSVANADWLVTRVRLEASKGLGLSNERDEDISDQQGFKAP